MRLRYDEDLVEAAVFLCASGRRAGMPALQVARFHREREKLYDILDPDDRNAAFFKLHLEWFREWGLEKLLTGLVQEFPLAADGLDTLAFRKAGGRNDEGAELYVNQSSALVAPASGVALPPQGPIVAVSDSPAQATSRPSRTGVVALRPERFAEDIALVRFLRHEFVHLQDMLDPAFGYAPELPVAGWNTAQQRLARERYRVLWDITIDGRLAAARHMPMASREQHWTAFTRAYSFWPPDQQSQVFAALWEDPAPCHARLAEWASDPRGLRAAQQPTPGAPCPLCGFSTFDWVDAGQLSAGTASHIRAEFPQWLPSEGLCGRCQEVYDVAARTHLETAAC